MRNRVALRYAIAGDLRFISHHDSLRLFARAFARTDLPVSYTQGFNPRPRIRIALPRPVGVASLDERVLVEFVTAVPPEEVRFGLSAQMPVGITILSADDVAAGDRMLPCRASYAVAIHRSTRGEIEPRITAFLSADSREIRRTNHKTQSIKIVDIRPYILSMNVNDNCLNWSQEITMTGTARVSEVLDSLGLSSCDHLHRLRREKVEYRC